MARAQIYPSRPVRLVVGFPAGGTNDIHARLIADWLSKQFGRSFIVENRPGAAGNIGLESVVRAAPDGYTLGVCGSTELRNEILYNDLKFSFMHDTAPVASMMLAMNVLVVHPAFSVKSVPELIGAAKANPDAMTVGVRGRRLDIARLLGTVQEHDGHAHVARALSGRGAGPHRPTCAAGAGLLRHARGHDGIHQSG
jgi:tripartite-type tricarboxylate transporter receptor subunit TctC